MAWTFGPLCGERANITASHRNTWFQRRLDFGRYTRLNIYPTRSVLRIFARNVVQTCLGAPGGGARSETKWEQKYFSLRKRLVVIDLFEGLRLVGTLPWR